MRRPIALLAAAIMVVTAFVGASSANAQGGLDGGTKAISLSRVGCESLDLVVRQASQADTLSATMSLPGSAPVTYTGAGDSPGMWRHRFVGLPLSRSNTVGVAEISQNGTAQYVMFTVPGCSKGVITPVSNFGIETNPISTPSQSKILSNKRPPVISGSPRIGGVLQGSYGTWGPKKPMLYGGQWFRVVKGRAVPIKGALGFDYRVRKGDRVIVFRSYAARVGLYEGIAFSAPVLIK